MNVASIIVLVFVVFVCIVAVRYSLKHKDVQGCDGSCKMCAKNDRCKVTLFNQEQQVSSGNDIKSKNSD